MELITGKLVTIHLIDENFLYTDDFREKYSWKNKYKVCFHPSADKFFSEVIRRPKLFRGNQIVVMAVNLARPDKRLTADLTAKCAWLIPGADIIIVCNDKELEKGVSSLRNGNIIQIVHNENTLLRIDNAITWGLAKINLEIRKKRFRLILYLFLISIAVTAAAFTLFRSPLM